jgi:hypothetical protein
MLVQRALDSMLSRKGWHIDSPLALVPVAAGFPFGQMAPVAPQSHPPAFSRPVAASATKRTRAQGTAVAARHAILGQRFAVILPVGR